MWHFKLKFLIFRSIGDQSIANTCYSNITRLPLLMSMACREFVCLMEVREIGRREKREGRESTIYIIYYTFYNFLLDSVEFQKFRTYTEKTRVKDKKVNIAVT